MADNIVLGRHRYYRRSDRGGDWWSDSGMVGYRQADALDEIERLRAEVDRLQQQVDWWVQTHGSIYGDERALQDEIDRLQAENAALTAQRDSLQSLLDDQVVLANALSTLLDHPHLSDEAIGRTLRARRQRHRDRLEGR